MTEKELKIRTRRFAIDVLNFIDLLPNRKSANIIAKIGIVEEESDESTFWLDILPETKNADRVSIEPLLNEARELTAIFTAASKTAKSNKNN